MSVSPARFAELLEKLRGMTPGQKTLILGTVLPVTGGAAGYATDPEDRIRGMMMGGGAGLGVAGGYKIPTVTGEGPVITKLIHGTGVVGGGLTGGISGYHVRNIGKAYTEKQKKEKLNKTITLQLAPEVKQMVQSGAVPPQLFKALEVPAQELHKTNSEMNKTALLNPFDWADVVADKVRPALTYGTEENPATPPANPDVAPKSEVKSEVKPEVKQKPVNVTAPAPIPLTTGKAAKAGYAALGGDEKNKLGTHPTVKANAKAFDTSKKDIWPENPGLKIMHGSGVTPAIESPEFKWGRYDWRSLMPIWGMIHESGKQKAQNQVYEEAGKPISAPGGKLTPEGEQQLTSFKGGRTASRFANQPEVKEAYPGTTERQRAEGFVKSDKSTDLSGQVNAAANNSTMDWLKNNWGYLLGGAAMLGGGALLANQMMQPAEARRRKRRASPFDDAEYDEEAWNDPNKAMPASGYNPWA